MATGRNSRLVPSAGCGPEARPRDRRDARGTEMGGDVVGSSAARGQRLESGGTTTRQPKQQQWLQPCRRQERVTQLSCMMVYTTFNNGTTLPVCSHGAARTAPTSCRAIDEMNVCTSTISQSHQDVQVCFIGMLVIVAPLRSRISNRSHPHHDQALPTAREMGLDLVSPAAPSPVERQSGSTFV